MKNSKKLILVMVSIMGLIALLVGSIAYYRIVVNGSIKGSTGNAVFVLRDSDNSVWNNKVIDLGKINPGDSGEFTVTMDASGSTVDMYATLEIERTNLPTNLKFYATSDHKSELHKYYSFLEKSGTNSETLTIYWYWNPYIDDVEDSKFINVSNLEANVKVSAVQISEYAMMKNGNGVTSDSRLYFWKDTYRPYIRTITFGNDLSNLPSSCTEENLCFDVSESNSKKKVYAYLIDSGLKMNNQFTLYNLYIVSEAPIFAPSDCSLFFAGFNNLISINYNNNFNTSKVTNMSYMFLPAESGDWSSVVVLTTSNNDVKPALLNKIYNSDVELMAAVGLSYYSSLENLDLSSFNTSNVTTMERMFSYCSSLTSLDLSNFNTKNVTNMANMFDGCSSLTSLVLGNFNTMNVTSMFQMFYYCSSLIALDLSSFYTLNVTDMHYMFFGCSSLTNLNLSSFNTSNVTNMSNMFSGCSSLTSLYLSNFNTSNVTNMSNMFSGCSSLTSLDLSNFNTSNVTNIKYMFSSCTSLTSLNLSSFNKLLDKLNSFTFLGCTSLKYLDISNCYFNNLEHILINLEDCTNLITTINITKFTYGTSYGLGLSSAKITINYTSDCEETLDAYLAAHPEYNWVKGKLITAPTSS